MQTTAIVFEKPWEVGLLGVELIPPTTNDVVIETLWSGISTGTEKMFWNGSMPPFPGMGYPLVPGYESVGRIVETGKDSPLHVGQLVFVPGSKCFKDISGLFGATASKLVVDGSKAIPVPEKLGEQAVLLALAATAYHAVAMTPKGSADLIIGHGVLGRLLARISLALDDKAPTVWEISPARQSGATRYNVISGDSDQASGYISVIDASGSVEALDKAIAKMAPGSMLTLAGFYKDRVSFNFPAAFMREAKLQISAEFKPADVRAVLELISNKRLSLDGLISHRSPITAAVQAYETAFNDPECIKMILNWKEV